MSKTAAASQPQTRRPGRPRSAQADMAILGAAVELLSRDGFAGMSMDELASLAGVSKATIYRRYSSKLDLVRDLVQRIASVMVLPDTGNAREDFMALTAQGIQQLSEQSRAALLMPRLASEGNSNPELAALVDEHLVGPRRNAMRTLVSRGVERGDLRADLDIDAATDLLVGALLFNFLTRGHDVEAIREIPTRVWDTLVAGMAAKPATKKPAASRGSKKR